MRKYLWITAASLVLLGCADDGTPKPTTMTRPKPNSNTTTDVDRTTVSKPAIGGGQTPATSATAPETTTSTDVDVARPDNTAVNQRDRDEQAVVPTDQGNNQEDLNITADIRKRILQNKEMSIKGQNVKIVTLKGKVTLRGPVASEAEKQKIEQIAQDVAGTDKVTSELEVAPE
jgi:hyperosmotically inducible periplasmic protein